MLGIPWAKIMASEKAQIECILDAAPIITNSKSCCVKSADFPPSKKISPRLNHNKTMKS